MALKKTIIKVPFPTLQIKSIIKKKKKKLLNLTVILWLEVPASHIISDPEKFLVDLATS